MTGHENKTVQSINSLLVLNFPSTTNQTNILFHSGQETSKLNGRDRNMKMKDYPQEISIETLNCSHSLKNLLNRNPTMEELKKVYKPSSQPQQYQCKGCLSLSSSYHVASA